MKKYISPELKISTSDLERVFMLTGSDGEGNTIVNPGDPITDPTTPVEGDAKKRDELGYGSLW